MHDPLNYRPIRPIERLTFEECLLITLKVCPFFRGQLAKLVIARTHHWKYFDKVWDTERYRQNLANGLAKCEFFFYSQRINRDKNVKV